jgi:HEPN domain-containing protein
MNRAAFQDLARKRIREAKVLLRSGSYEGAYYLAGYSIECALKPCIAKQTKRYDFPPSLDSVREIYTHNLERLLKKAGLAAERDKEIGLHSGFGNNWKVVKDWDPGKRYAREVPEQTARDLYSAISDPRYGVFAWLKKFW